MKRTSLFGFILALVLAAPAVAHSETLAQALPEVKTYEELRHAISEARAQSRVRTEKAVEKERVREAWEIGRLIDAHVLRRKERADYARHVLSRLAGDLGMSDTELYRMLEFYRAYPIFAHARKLSWSEHRDLLAVNDPEKREALAERVEKENWSRDRLRAEVKAVKGKDDGPAVERLTARPGKPGTYKIVKAAAGPEPGKEAIDLGFSNYYKTSGDFRFREGAIVEVIPAAQGAGSAPSDKIKLSKRTSEDLYTYRAYVVDILDGDTLKAVIDLGFGVRSVQTLRFRGIDAPELVTADGMESKKALEKMLGKISPVLVRTVKSDKYDRYLVDVFLPARSVKASAVPIPIDRSEAEIGAALTTVDKKKTKVRVGGPGSAGSQGVPDEDGKEQYLNNLLLEQGYAVRVQS